MSKYRRYAFSGKISDRSLFADKIKLTLIARFHSSIPPTKIASQCYTTSTLHSAHTMKHATYIAAIPNPKLGNGGFVGADDLEVADGCDKKRKSCGGGPEVCDCVILQTSVLTRLIFAQSSR